MGVGVGGDYPLSAIMASEFASKKIRGRMMVSIFACQGWGNIGTFSPPDQDLREHLLTLLID